MSGPIATGQKRAAIIGAGLSGLATAYFLNKRGWQVEVFEERDHAGGLISSRVTEHGLVETAANGILNSTLVESIASDIGCPLISTKKESRARFIVRSGRPRQWPLSMAETFQLVMAATRYFVARASVAPKKLESLRDWGSRVLGARTSQYTIETAVQGVYAMPTNEQSATLTLKRFFEKREVQGGTPPPKPLRRGTVSANAGLGEFVGKLEAVLIERGVKFHFKSKVDSLPSGFDATVIATSAVDSARLLRAAGDQRAAALEHVQMQGLISITIFWPESAVGLKGFGCLFPQGEGHAALGVLMNTFIFENRAQPGAISETWIFPYSDASDEKFLEMIKTERSKIGQPQGEPLKMHVTRWPKALPRYDRDLEANLAAIAARTDSASPHLVGNYLGEIGLKNLIARANQTAEQIDKERK